MSASLTLRADGVRRDAIYNSHKRGERGALGSIGFLFLGELHLIPHLLPIALAIARRPSAPDVILFVSTSVHEEIIKDAILGQGLANIRIDRVRGFLALEPGRRNSPSLPSKPLIMALNAVRILRNDVVVVAERTSLWLPMLSPGKTPFIYNEHGAAPHANFKAKRNRYAARILMPSEGMAARARASGTPGAGIQVVGYMKRDFVRQLSGRAAMPRFSQERPTVVYAPHWKREKSSWWSVGEQVLEYFASSGRFNLILAPHVRLPKFDSRFEKRIARFRNIPSIHIDATSFNLVDQTYINGADMYLGDGSSQVVEFVERPRPVVFLNPDRIDWKSDPRFSHWGLGQVICSMTDLECALMEAPKAHSRFAEAQLNYVERMMGKDDELASERAADVTMAVLACSMARLPGDALAPNGRIASDLPVGTSTTATFLR